MKYKRRISLLMISVMAILGITGCKGEENMKKAVHYEQISQDEAKKIMEEEDNYIILDVRTIEEYDDSHIAGAICVPNETIIDTAPEELPDKDQLILVYCRSGNRSKQAADKLANLGYRNIKEFGGINTWQYEIESSSH